MTLKPYLKTRTIIIVEIKPTRMLVFQSFPLRYRTDRVVKEDNQWYRIGNSREIIIFEKPEEDIIASKYQISHFGDIGKKGQFPAGGT